MKRRALSLLGALAGLALLVAGLSDRVQLVEAADHGGGDVLISTAPPEADLTDFYAWRWDDNGTASLAMIINAGPDSAPTATFPDNVQYVFTLVRDPLGTPTQSQLVCQFTETDNTGVRCFFGDDASFVVAEGNPNAGDGFTDNGIRVFAGIKDDPFYFNGAGFGATVSFVRGAGLTIDGTCPDLTGAGTNPDQDNPDGGIDTLAGALVQCLTTDCAGGPGDAVNAGPAGPTDLNAFAGQNVLSLTVSIPIDMIPGSGAVVAAHGSSHTAP